MSGKDILFLPSPPPPTPPFPWLLVERTGNTVSALVANKDGKLSFLTY